MRKRLPDTSEQGTDELQSDRICKEDEGCGDIFPDVGELRRADTDITLVVEEDRTYKVDAKGV